MDALDLERWFENTRVVLETAYLSEVEPWRQSGMSGPEERWINLRKPVADCIDRDGSFLDIGCANGYLMECVMRWTAERGLRIDPYGVDISERLLDLARGRLPEYAGRLFRGNAFYWTPPRRFDFVRTELVYVPGDYEREYVQRLLDEFLNPGGRLLVANYGEGRPHPESGLLPGSHPARDILVRLKNLGFATETFCDGYDPIKGRRVRIAALNRL
jgi:SAM-dependent methyltransferase